MSHRLVGLGVALLIAVWGSYWYPVLSGERQLIMGDLTLYWLGSKSYFAERIATGEWPLWIPRLGFGTPYLADPSHQVFYPFNGLFALIPDTVRAIGVFVALHLGLALVAAYTLLWILTKNSLAALWGAALYGFSGVVLSSGLNLTYLPAVVWVPLGIAAAAWCGASAIGALRVGGCVAALLLAGDVINAGGLIIVTTLIWLVRRPRGWPAVLVVVALTWLVSIALASVQILPTLDLFQDSARANALAASEIGTWSFPWPRVVEFVQPYHFGARYPYAEFSAPDLYPERQYPWFESLYVGVVPVALALWTLSRSQTAQAYPGIRWVFIAILIASLAFSLGRYLPAFDRWIELVPFANRQRYPEKLLLWANLSLCVLAVWGATYLRARPIRAPHRAITGIIVLLALGLGVWALALVLPNHTLDPRFAKSVSLYWSDRFGFQTTHRGGLLLHAAMGCGLLIMLVVAYRHIRHATVRNTLVSVGLVGAIGLQLAVHWDQIPSVDQERFKVLAPPAVVGALDQASGPTSPRILFDAPHLALRTLEANPWAQVEAQFKARLMPNYGVAFGITYLNADFAPLAPDARLDHVRKLLASPSEAALRAAGVEFVITGAVRPVPKWSGIGQVIYDDHEQDVRVLAIADAVARFEHRAGMQLGGSRAHETRSSQPHAHQFALASDDKPSEFMIRETYSDNWRAKVDDIPVAIRPTPSHYMSIAIPPGGRVLSVEYREPLLPIGITISALTLVAWMSYEWLARTRRPRRNQAKRETAKREKGK
ncbi:MAG: YfhO family protein [Pseudomonadota bacterium]